MPAAISISFVAALTVTMITFPALVAAATQCPDKGQYFSVAKGSCDTCPQGYYCPGEPQPFPVAIPCPPGYYQPDTGQALGCRDCPQDTICPDNATVTPRKCPEGRSSPARSASRSCSAECDQELYYLSPLNNDTCIRRNVTCDLSRHYEIPNITGERTCVPLTVCRTQRITPAQSPIQGDPVGVASFEPLYEYIQVR